MKCFAQSHIQYMLCIVTQSFWLFASPWTLAHQAPLSMEFSKEEYWNELPFPSPGDLPDSGIEPRSLALQGFLTVWATRETHTKTFWFLPPLKTQPHSFFLPSLPCLLFHRILLHGSNSVPMGTLAPVCFVYPSLLYNPSVDFSTEFF